MATIHLSLPESYKDWLIYVKDVKDIKPSEYIRRLIDKDREQDATQK